MSEVPRKDSQKNLRAIQSRGGGNFFLVDGDRGSNPVTVTGPGGLPSNHRR